MRSERPRSGSDTPPAPAERTCRYADPSSGDGLCKTPRAADGFAASPPNPGVRIRSCASAHRCARGKIAQTERIPARVEVVKRAEANTAQIARAQSRPTVTRALSSSGKACENNLEEAASA